MAGFRSFLQRAARWPIIGVFLVIFLVLNAVVFPRMSARIEEASGGVGAVDLLFSYTPEEVFSMIDAYGEMRGAYATFELTADVIYPITYSLLFGLLITLIFQHTFAPGSPLQALNLVPFAMAIIDLLENISLVIMLTGYPSQPVALAQAASVFTSLKWILFAVTLVCVVVGVVVWLYRKIANKPLPA